MNPPSPGLSAAWSPPLSPSPYAHYTRTHTRTSQSPYPCFTLGYYLKFIRQCSNGFIVFLCLPISLTISFSDKRDLSHSWSVLSNSTATVATNGTGASFISK